MKSGVITHNVARSPMHECKFCIIIKKLFSEFDGGGNLKLEPIVASQVGLFGSGWLLRLALFANLPVHCIRRSTHRFNCEPLHPAIPDKEDRHAWPIRTQCAVFEFQADNTATVPSCVIRWCQCCVD